MKRLLWTFLLCLLITPLLASPQRADADAGYRGRVHVTVRGLRNDTGRAMLVLFRNETGFPTEPPPKTASLVVPIEKGVASAQFLNVAPGPFAVSVLHDEDSDGKVGSSMFRIPSEGLGFSRNPKPRFGPPRWEDCVVVLGKGKRETMTVEMHYY